MVLMGKWIYSYPHPDSCTDASAVMQVLCNVMIVVLWVLMLLLLLLIQMILLLLQMLCNVVVAVLLDSFFRISLEFRNEDAARRLTLEKATPTNATYYKSY